MKKTISGKIYNFTPPQEMINFMLKYSFLHKQVIQIPETIILSEDIDFDLMKKAFNIEIERNDSMRLRFFKEKKQLKQYFLPEYKVDDIPVLSFSSKDEQEKYFEAEAQKPLKMFKEEIFRIKFFHTYDKRCGIFFNVSHLAMDNAAVFVFFDDLLKIYDHLKDGAPMPKPLGKFEDIIVKELAYAENPDNIKRDEEIYKQFFLKDGDPLYAGVHGPELLEKERIKKKKPDLRAPGVFDPIHDKANLLKFQVPAEESNKILNFIEENHVSPECLIQLAMKVHISMINYRTPDTYFVTLCSRRKTKTEKRAGGNVASPLPYRIVIEEDKTFKEALGMMSDLQGWLYRNMDYPYMESRELVRKLFDYTPFQASSSLMFSWFPLDENSMNKHEYEFSGYNLGAYILLLYAFAMKDTSTGCLKFSYMFRTKFISDEHIKALHENTIKVLIAGIENPDLTLGQIMDTL